MRGPLLSGPVGHPATLARLCQIVRAHPPTVVLSSLWLASELAAEIPVLVLVEPDVRRQAQRALQRSAGARHQLSALLAAEDLPLRRGSAGSLVIEGLTEIEDPDASPFLAALVPALRPDGVVLSLDGTKDPLAEARLAGLFLSATLTGIAQERPREGAVLTVGHAPAAAVSAVGIAASVGADLPARVGRIDDGG
jgi:hypothetical protein